MWERLSEKERLCDEITRNKKDKTEKNEHQTTPNQTNNINWPNVWECKVLEGKRDSKRPEPVLRFIFDQQERKWYKCRVVFPVFVVCFFFYFGIQRSDNGERDTNKWRQSSVKAHADKGISEPNPTREEKKHTHEK